MVKYHCQNFHDQMHILIFRDVGASRLGAVQTTLVWNFVINHYQMLDEDFCQELIALQIKINTAPRNSILMDAAITALLEYIQGLDVLAC